MVLLAALTGDVTNAMLFVGKGERVVGIAALDGESEPWSAALNIRARTVKSYSEY